MKVQLLTSLASFRKVNHAGDIVDLPFAEAKRRIEDGQAIPYREEQVERAVLKVPENASRRRGRPPKNRQT